MFINARTKKLMVLPALILALLAALLVPAPAEAASLNGCKKANDVKACEADFKACEKRYEQRAEQNRCEESVVNRYDSGSYKCGNGDDAIRTKFNLGCSGEADNPIIDLSYAIISFLSAGVGVVVVIVIIIAGIKYSSAEGNPEATMQAKRTIQEALIGLVVYIFAFAIINYLVPGGLLF